MAAKKKDDFESQLAKLQEIVEKLENGGQPLEEGVDMFKEGVALAKSCRERLKNARNEVTMLAEGALKEFGVEDE